MYNMSEKRIISFLVPFLLAAITATGGVEKLTPGLTTVTVTAGDESGKTVPVDIFIPHNEKIIGDILVLPGWSFARARWHRETSIVQHAEQFGFRLVFPEMGVTIYESEYFPESWRKWGPVPGGKWIAEIFIPLMQEQYGLFLKGNRNYVMGLSTGGRGAVLCCIQNPKLFTAAASLSGDFNQHAMPKDRLMAAIYGPCEKFSDRWREVDNPETVAREKKWRTPLYIGHGKMDTVTPFNQSESFFRAVSESNPKLKLVFNAPEEMGHDFTYWDAEVKPVLEFFRSTE